MRSLVKTSAIGDKQLVLASSWCRCQHGASTNCCLYWYQQHPTVVVWLLLFKEHFQNSDYRRRLFKETKNIENLCGYNVYVCSCVNWSMFHTPVKSSESGIDDMDDTRLTARPYRGCGTQCFFSAGTKSSSCATGIRISNTWKAIQRCK